MQERNCVVCGALFPLTQKTRMTCSKKCGNKKDRNIRLERDRIARKAILENPLYSKVQLAEAKHNIKIYSDPKLAKGREYVLIKARQIIEYYEKRQKIEDRVLALRERTKKTTQAWYRKKKNDTPIQPVS